MDLDLREWLETDGLGGYAMGTASGVRTRRYHALLVTATRAPAGRMVLVNGLEAWVETEGGSVALSTHRYQGGVLHPDGVRRLASFSAEPWPTWTWTLGDGASVVQELFLARGSPEVFLRWRAVGAGGALRLRVRPLLSGRDHHALHRENPAFRFAHAGVEGGLSWSPYPGVPSIRAISNGDYEAAPLWYRAFVYDEEAARGLDSVEDLASPGLFTFALDREPAALVLSAVGPERAAEGGGARRLEEAAERERARRARFATPLARAADAYLVARGGGRSVIAGYPWFTDWGRDTFISLRGLCLAEGRLEEARDVAATWLGVLSEGMLPNRFQEQGEAPAYDSVDATLWFVLAVAELLRQPDLLGAAERRGFSDAIREVVERWATGTRYGIRRDADGLLACGQPGTRLTWMDAAVAGRGVTPRVGKPVEIQALWINALMAAAALEPRRTADAERARAGFAARFWDPARRWLHDVVDVDHVAGSVDSSLRPNQILAVGGLPIALVEGERARRVLSVVEERLWTPMGLRTLAPDDPRYTGRYEGPPSQRDAAYHQGTAWPWLLGPFVDAWITAHGGGPEARREARRRFLEPLLAFARDRGFGHLPEIADGDGPHVARGCPFQAWSVGAALEIERATRHPSMR